MPSSVSGGHHLTALDQTGEGLDDLGQFLLVIGIELAGGFIDHPTSRPRELEILEWLGCGCGPFFHSNSHVKSPCVREEVAA